MHDRGVSDVLGFILVFSLIIATVGVVFVAGTGGLESARDAERVNNAERAFDVLAANIDAVVREGAPSRATELKLADASLGYSDRTSISVEVINDSGVTVNSTTAEFRPITFRAANTELVYETGALFRSDRGDAVLLRDPYVVADEDHLLVQFAETQASEPRTVAGEQTVLLRVRESARRVSLDERLVDRGDIEVRISITTAPDRAPVWTAHLNDQLEWADDPCSVSDDVVTCVLEGDDLPDRLTISTTRMRMEIS